MKKLLILLIIFTGIFFFPMESSKNIVHIPQKGFMLFSAGILLSCLIWKYDAIISIMAAIVSGGFIITLLRESVPTLAVYDFFLYSICVLTIFYAVRNFEIDEKVLRWILVPAIINIIIVFIQRFAPGIIPLKSSTIETAGMLGSGGLTASFLGLTTPIFIRWFPIGLPFLIFATILDNLLFSIASGLGCFFNSGFA